MGYTNGQVRKLRHLLRTHAGYHLTTGLHPWFERVTASRPELAGFVKIHNATPGAEPIHWFGVAKDFSPLPGSRYCEDHTEPGHSAEELVPKLAYYLRKCTEPVPGFQRGAALILDLDFVAGYAASFLDEVFRSLVTKEGFSVDELREYVIVLSLEEEYLLDEIFETLREVEKEFLGLF